MESDELQKFSIFDFFDYRAYLSDFYKHKKALNSRFSHRVFARKAGYKSPSLFIGIVNGQNRLTDPLLPKFANALGLNAPESLYLRHMVDYCHASSLSAKQHYFDQMVQLLPPRVMMLTAGQKEYYRNWYNVVIREALTFLDIDEDPSQLYRLLHPKVTRNRIIQSLSLLGSLGLIRKDPKGFWKAADPFVSGNRNVDLVSMYAFRTKMIDFAKKALWKFPPEERNISCLTCALSSQMSARIHRKINQFRREISELARTDQGEDRIYQLNLQFFPLTQRNGNDRE